MPEPLAYSQKDAAAALGVSLSHFKRHVRPEVRPVFTGGRVIFPASELRRWLEQSA